MVDISVLFGQSLGPFVLGKTLYSVVETISSDLPTWKACVLTDQGVPGITVLVCGPGGDSYTLKFDPALQLLRSAAYALPVSPAKGERQDFRGTCDISLRHPLSIRKAIDSFGTPAEFHTGSYGERRAVHLVYNGACLVFGFRNPEHRDLSGIEDFAEMKSWLFEIRIAPHADSRFLELCNGQSSMAKIQFTHFGIPEVHLVVHHSTKEVAGLEITPCQATGDTNQPASSCYPTSTTLFFTETLEDVLTKLGSPDQVYYKDRGHWESIGEIASHVNQISNSDIFLGYPHLGIDILLNTRTDRVGKIVLHTNVPYHSEFCSQAHCPFKLSLSRDGLSTTTGKGETLLVTPATSWKVIKSHVNPNCLRHLRRCHYAPSSNTCYPFPDTNLWVLFDQLLIETTHSERIAKITVLPPGEATILQSRQPAMETELNKPGLELKVREEERKFETQVRVEDRHSSHSSEGEEEEEDFHSAESSLASTGEQGQDPSERPSTSDGSHEARVEKCKYETRVVTEKVYFSSNVNAVRGRSTSLSCDTPQPAVDVQASVVYELLSGGEEHFRQLPLPRDSILYESQTLRILAEARTQEETGSVVPGEPAEGAARADLASSSDSPEINGHLPSNVLDCDGTRDISPECNSFDLLSYSEVVESQRDSQEVQSNGIPANSQHGIEDGHVLAIASSTDASSDSPSNFSPPEQELDGIPNADPPRVQLQSSDDSLESSNFHYQPTATDLTALRVMSLSQDIGILTRHSDPVFVSRVTRTGKSTKGLPRSILRTDSELPQSASKPSTTRSPPSAAKKTSQALHHGASGSERRLIVQRRSGSNMSAREESRKRLLGHTKSSQQRVKQRYPSNKEMEEGEKGVEEEDKEEGEEGQKEVREKKGEEEEEEEEEEEGEEKVEGEEEFQSDREKSEVKDEDTDERSKEVSEATLATALSESNQGTRPQLSIVAEELDGLAVNPTSHHPSTIHNPAKLGSSPEEASQHNEEMIHPGHDTNEGISISDSSQPYAYDLSSIPEPSPSDHGVTHCSPSHLSGQQESPLYPSSSPSAVFLEGSEGRRNSPTSSSDVTITNAGLTALTELPTNATEETPVQLSRAGTVTYVAMEGTSSDLQLSAEDGSFSLLDSTAGVHTPNRSPSPNTPAVTGTSSIEYSDPLTLPADAGHSPRKAWGEETFMPGFGPPSMTQERVVLELISCEHEEVHSKLKTRQESLVHLWKGLLQNQEHPLGPGDLDHMISHDATLLPNLLSALNQHRALWNLKLVSELTPSILGLFHSTAKLRHLLAACVAVSAIVEDHGMDIQRYHIGRLPCSSEQRAQYQVCKEMLEEVTGRVDRLIPTLQHSTEGEGELGTEVLEQLGTLRDGLSKIFKKVQLD